MKLQPAQLALYGHDEVSLYGTAAVLGVEKIPYRRIFRLEALAEDEVLLVAGELANAEVAQVLRRPAVVLNGGAHFAELAFGRTATVVSTQPVVMPLDAGLWPQPLARRLARFGQAALSLPLAPVCHVKMNGAGRPAGMMLTPVSCQPATLLAERCVWSPLDVGAAFTHLMTESYVREPPGVLGVLPFERAIQSFYYAAPGWMRRQMQTLSYQRAKRRLSAVPWLASDYPTDSTGNILIEFLKGLIELAGVSLVRLHRWPSPHGSAALMTHDVEPSRYAYRVGLDRLLDQQLPTDHPVLGLVPEAACGYLDGDAVARLRRFDVLCHGRTHLGESISKWPVMARELEIARSRLEGKVGRRIRGYRSPRLCRSNDLLRALDSSGFEYDSSYPDSDRETLTRYGAGVRLNIPYRAPIEEASGRLRPSRCLELPLAAPDCVQPLFAGETRDALREAVCAKAKFVRSTGGLHVALVHAGVFDDDDAALREQHRQFVAHELNAAGTWLPQVSDLLDWWRGRENLTIVWRRGRAFVHNSGHRTVHHLRAVIEAAGGERVVAVPPVEPGATNRLFPIENRAAALGQLESVFQ